MKQLLEPEPANAEWLASEIETRVAFVEGRAGDFETARGHATDAAELLRQRWLGPWPVRLVFRIAQALHATGHYLQALALLRETRDKAELPLLLEARSEWLQAIFATERARFEDVVGPAWRAAQACESLGNSHGLGVNLRLLGRALVRIGNPTEGVLQLQAAVAFLAQAEQPLAALQAEFDLAHGLAQAGDVDGAERLATAASRSVPAGAPELVSQLATAVALHYRLELHRRSLLEGSFHAVAHDALVVAEAASRVSFRLQVEAACLFAAALAAGGAFERAGRVYECLRGIVDFPRPQGAPELSSAIGWAPRCGLWGLALLSLRNGDRDAARARLAELRRDTTEIHLTGFYTRPSEEARLRLLDRMRATLEDSVLPATGTVQPWVTAFLHTPGSWVFPIEDAFEDPVAVRRKPIGSKRVIGSEPSLPIDDVLPDVRELTSVTGLMIDEGLIGFDDPELFSYMESSKSLVLLAELTGRDLWHMTGVIAEVRATGKTDPFAVAGFLRTVPGTVMLQFFVSERNTTIWMLSGSPDTCVTIQLEGFGQFELERLIEVGWNAPLAIVQSGEADEAQRAEALAVMNETLVVLYELLFETESGDGRSVAKILDRVACEAIVFVPHSRLHEVPLHALLDRHGVYLCDRYDVSYLPAARLVMRPLMQRARSVGDRMVVINNPDGSLPNASSELDVIREAFPNAEVWGPGHALSRDVLAVLSGTDVLHFSCHAFFDRQDWRDSGLVLSKGDILTIKQLLATDRHVRERPYGARLSLVFLAACETSVYARSSHDEIMSLATAFLVCGAPRVIGSLWPAYDACAVSVVREFYRLVRVPGVTAARALRMAQRLARGTFAHPIHWANLQLIGS